MKRILILLLLFPLNLYATLDATVSQVNNLMDFVSELNSNQIRIPCKPKILEISEMDAPTYEPFLVAAAGDTFPVPDSSLNSNVSCYRLSGSDYYKCKAYTQGSSCGSISGNGYYKCRTWKNGGSCSSLSGNDYYKCRVYVKKNGSCSSLSGSDYNKCRVFLGGANCSWLSGDDYYVCKALRGQGSCNSLSGRNYDLCKTYKGTPFYNSEFYLFHLD